MNTTHVRKVMVLLFVMGGFITQLIPVTPTSSHPTPSPQTPPAITISPNVPSDITPPASLQSAAAFAWQEFIALNWPAVRQTGKLNTRDMPDTSKKFGDPQYSGLLVWHTFRGKVEIFPGKGNPPGFVNSSAASYGYDAPPKYIYQSGPIAPYNPKSPVGPTPWINLDEINEIGLDTMYAGVGAKASGPGPMILFLAKANRTQYTYVAANKWWANNVPGSNPTRSAVINSTASYIAANKKDPPPNSNNLVSFPNGTIEVKSAWRKLAPTEDSSRFYTTRVRYYRQKQNGQPGYIDDTFGLVALHIIQKTPSAPYFIYATFSQADNLLDANGNRIEDENGKLLLNQNANPLEPAIVSRNATSTNPPTPQTIQQLSPPTSTATPQNRLYYINTPTTPTPPPTTQGMVALNRRIHNIPPTIIAANQAAHAAIKAYNPSAVWQYYKLINVQYEPYDKPPGITYTGASGGPDPSTYYQANEVVETNYNLQVFSGRFQGSLPPPYDTVNINNLITDYNYPPSGPATTFKNVYDTNGNSYLMGGCMGCHGNAQVAGAGFSFIFQGGPVASPEAVNSPASSLKKFIKLFVESPMPPSRSNRPRRKR